LAAIKVGGVHALAHITGGGLTENLPRALPAGLGAEIDLTKIPPLPVMGWLKRAGYISEAEMLKTFNCGIGMVLSVDSERAEPIERELSQYEMQPIRLGHVIAGEGVQYVGELQS
jgi:phosphoribosylformylglycinamidine cyclo-ligase